MTKRLIWAGLAVWAVIIVAVATVAESREQGPIGAARTFTADVSAEGVEIFDMAAADGAVIVTGTNEDRIRISVEVTAPETPAPWYERGAGNPDRAELIAERRGAAFVAQIRAPGGSVVERWTIQVPQRLRVGIKANDTGIEVTDVAGGVLATANAGMNGRPGRMRVSVPGGLLDLSLNVGTVDAQTTSAARGPVDVRSSVGDARLSIAGRQIKSPREAGPGHRLQVNDDGPDRMTVRVHVGDASLNIR